MCPIQIYILDLISSFVDDRSIRTSIISFFFFLLVASIISFRLFRFFFALVAASIILYFIFFFFFFRFFSRVLKPGSEDVLCVDTHDVFFFSIKVFFVDTWAG